MWVTASSTSQGADCTVFFMHISEKYRPIGFICTPAPVTSLQWSPPGKVGPTHTLSNSLLHTPIPLVPQRGVRVLACCEDGSMVEAISPLEGDYDVSKTFHLEPLPCSTRTFTSIKDRLRVSPSPLSPLPSPLSPLPSPLSPAVCDVCSLVSAD